MVNVKTVQTLIDMARARVGTDAALARRLGVPGHHPHEWRKGLRAVTPEVAAALCDVLELTGEEAREWVAVAIVENPKNAGKVELLKRALFACWVLGVGALFTTNDAKATEAGVSMTPSTECQAPSSYGCVTSVLYIVARWLRTGLDQLVALGRSVMGFIRPAIQARALRV